MPARKPSNPSSPPPDGEVGEDDVLDDTDGHDDADAVDDILCGGVHFLLLAGPANSRRRVRWRYRRFNRKAPVRLIVLHGAGNIITSY